MQGIGIAAGSEVDFMIHGIFSYELFGQTLWITTSHVCLSIVVLSLMVFCIFANKAIKKGKQKPGTFQNIVELIVEMLDKMVHGVMGKSGDKFVNYIGTIFIFLNLLSKFRKTRRLRFRYCLYKNFLTFLHISYRIFA